MKHALGFRNRREAGRVLAGRLRTYADRDDVVILAIPRGGVPVAYEVAKDLRAPLDVFTVRKLGVPGCEELAMGAIASRSTIIDRRLVEALGLGPREIDSIIKAELTELERRERVYRNNRPPPEIEGKTVIVVDDGLATGASLLAAVRALRRLRPARIVAAAPVGASETCAALESEADEVVCVLMPEPFHAVGCHYENFVQTSDDEVRALLAAANENGGPRRAIP